MSQGSLITRAGLLAISLWSQVAYPCTTFHFLDQQGSSYFGRNMDYATGIGFVAINQRDRVKRALLSPREGQTPAEWRANYGSVTFSQFGRELPYGGMNERGLVVEVMILEDSVYPSPPFTRPVVNESAFVQYLLDTQDSVGGAIAAARHVAISPLLVKLHYLVCDAGGSCATIEYLNGQLTIHQGDTLPVAGVSNSPYDASVASLSQYDGFGGQAPIPQDTSSLSRFARMAKGLNSIQGTRQAETSAFQLLNEVKNTNTRWQIVYDQTHRTLSFHTDAMPSKTTIALDQLDFQCGRAFQAMDLDGAVFSPARSWFTDTATHRRQLAKATLQALNAQVPEALVEAAVLAPDQSPCAVSR